MFQKYHENFALQLFIICSNLPVKFAIFLKIAYFFTVPIVFFNYKQSFNALITRK